MIARRVHPGRYVSAGRSRSIQRTEVILPCFEHIVSWDLVKLARDLTRPISPKWWFSKGNLLISGKSRLVKYYNLARWDVMYWSYCQALFCDANRWSQPQDEWKTIEHATSLTLILICFEPSICFLGVHVRVSVFLCGFLKKIENNDVWTSSFLDHTT